MTCAHVAPRCWCSPPPLWPVDLDRWEAFCREVEGRIALTRRLGGRDDIGTFSSPIPANVETTPLPVGRIAPLPSNHGHRDQRGRFSAQKAT